MRYDKEVMKAENRGRQHFVDDYGRYFMLEETEGQTNRSDLYATAITSTGRTYIIEVKNYDDEQHPREYAKFTYKGKDYGYQIDLDKIDYLVTKGKEEGRIPILYARFNDITVTWDLTDIPYKERVKQVWTNKTGVDYGKEKELTWQTYLYKDEAKQVKTTTTE